MSQQKDGSPCKPFEVASLLLGLRSQRVPPPPGPPSRKGRKAWRREPEAEAAELHAEDLQGSGLQEPGAGRSRKGGASREVEAGKRLSLAFFAGGPLSPQVPGCHVSPYTYSSESELRNRIQEVKPPDAPACRVHRPECWRSDQQILAGTEGGFIDTEAERAASPMMLRSVERDAARPGGLGDTSVVASRCQEIHPHERGRWDSHHGTVLSWGRCGERLAPALRLRPVFTDTPQKIKAENRLKHQVFL
ncbi:uncharacterized protein WM277_008754 [Molossus nigricans]